ncbi:hypothetical protein PENARI_c010G06057, partial [Penicillium arizonense]
RYSPSTPSSRYPPSSSCWRWRRPWCPPRFYPAGYVPEEDSGERPQHELVCWSRP